MDAEHGLVTLLSLSVSVKDRSLHKPSRQVTDLLSRAHTWVWALVYGTACLRFSIVVRTERYKMEKGNMIAHHLLESSTGAYIEWLVNEPMRLLIKIEYKDARLVMLPANAINP